MNFKAYYNTNKASVIAGFQQDYIDKFIEKSDDTDSKFTDMVFVIDKSGSMEDTFSFKKEKKSKIVLSALNHSVNYLKILSRNNHKIRLSVISFDENPNLLLDKIFVDDTPDFNFSFDTVKVNLKSQGGTDIYKALQFTTNHVETILQTNNNIDNVNIFIMTDGYNNNKNDNAPMVDFFKSIPYRNRFVGMGIGNATDYDVELLDRLFIKLKGSPSAIELSDNISSDTFGACSCVATDLNIIFEDYGDSKFYSPINFEKKDDKIYISLDKVDLSQKLIFSFDNTSGFSSLIKMKVSYKNIIEDKEESFEMFLNTGENNDSINDKINTLTHNIHEFVEITKSSLSHKDNQQKTDKLISKFFEWNQSERSGDLADIWTANENIVLNHKNELDKYVDLQSYNAYTRMYSKQIENTINIGVSPALARQFSDNICVKYKSEEYNKISKKIPEEIDFDGLDLKCPDAPRMSRQSSCQYNYNELSELSDPLLTRELSPLAPYDSVIYREAVTSITKNLYSAFDLVAEDNGLKSPSPNNYTQSNDLNL